MQYAEFYDVNDDDYERSKLKTVYEIPMLVGVESFGINCGLEIPSVGTRIFQYKDWIELQMMSNWNM